MLIKTGAANTGYVVHQQIRTNYLPTCLTDFECVNCHKILKVQIVSSLVPVDLKVKYIDYSKYQFLISVEFKERVTSPFKMVVRFNNEFRKCLGEDNYNQQL